MYTRCVVLLLELLEDELLEVLEDEEVLLVELLLVSVPVPVVVELLLDEELVGSAHRKSSAGGM